MIKANMDLSDLVGYRTGAVALIGRSPSFPFPAPCLADGSDLGGAEGDPDEQDQTST